MSKKSVRDLTMTAIRAFQHEGGINLEDIDKLLSIALEDDMADPKEKKALHQVFRFCREEDVTPAVWMKIQELSNQYQV